MLAGAGYSSRVRQSINLNFVLKVEDYRYHDFMFISRRVLYRKMLQKIQKCIFIPEERRELGRANTRMNHMRRSIGAIDNLRDRA